MKVKIADIRVNKRVRRELEDLNALAESLKKYGQIEPIVITTGGKLVAGQRRLEAAKKLGWTEIESHIVDVDDAADLLELEIEENLQRKPFDEADLLAGYNRLDRLRNPSFLMRIIIAIKKFFAKIFGRKK